MPIDVAVQGAYTRVGIPLKVRAIAVVKISSNPQVVMNAIERFLGRGLGDIQQVAKETLEGNLRGVLATLTPEEVNEDRLKFAESLAQEVEQDLAKLGLHLDVLKIQHVTDDANYLDSIGRGRDRAGRSGTPRSPSRTPATRRPRRRPPPRCGPRWPRPTPSARSPSGATSCAGSPPSWRRRPSRSRSGPRRARWRRRPRPMQALQAVRRELEAVRLQSDVVIPAEIKREAAALAAAGARRQHRRERPGHAPSRCRWSRTPG